MNAPPTGLFARPTRVPIWRFALRDLRGGLNGLRIFLLCIALGVAAIVGVESLAQALNDGLGREGRVILGGDASFSLIHRRLSADEQRFLESHGSLSTIATVRGMARAASGDAALIEIKAVEPSWPRLGAAVFAPPMSLKDALGEKDGVFGAAVEEALMARLNLKLGDVIRIGDASFALRTVLVSEPDRLATGIGLGPRVLMSQAALDATKLVQPGSLVRWTTRVVMGGPRQAPDNSAVQALMAEAKRTFPHAGWDARSRLNISPDFSNDLDRFAEYLTLAGLLSLVVGGVGVANAAQGFVERKRATLAILKAIGATGSGVVGLALVEFAIVALIGAFIGAGVGSAIPFAVAWAFGSLLPLPLAPSIAPSVIGLGLIYGLLTALAFSIPSLGRAHDLPVTTLIRDLVEERRDWPRKRYLGLAAARRSGSGRARRAHEPPAVDCGDGRRRDGRRVCRAEARRFRHRLARAPRAPLAPRRDAHGACRHPPPWRADAVGRAVAWPGPHRSRRAHAHRREHARGVARGSTRRDAELLFP